MRERERERERERDPRIQNKCFIFKAKGKELNLLNDKIMALHFSVALF